MKKLAVLLLIASLLLIVLSLLGVLRLCLPLLCLCRLLCLPLIWGGRRWPADISVMVTPRYLLRLHVRLMWLLRLHGVYFRDYLAHGRHLKLQCIYRSL